MNLVLPLPLDIEYLILADLSHLGDHPTRDEYNTILRCLRVCSRWHSTLQELLIRNNPARSLLQSLNKIGQVAVERAAAEYVARKKQTHPDPNPNPDPGPASSNNRHGPQREISTPEFPATYSARISKDRHDLVFLSKDLERCAHIAPGIGDLVSLRTCLSAGVPYNSWWMLLVAVNHNETEIIKYILDAGYGFTDPEQKRSCLTRLMQRAVGKGHGEVVSIFLERGAADHLNNIDPRILIDGRYRSVSMVSYAAFQNQAAVLDILLRWGMGIEDPDVPYRPVYWAVKHDNLEMMGFFIRHGVDLARGKDGDERDWPLGWAVRHGSAAMVRLLLEHTPLPRWGRSWKKTLSRAVEERGDDEIRQVLASHGLG
ncbi:ankyrin repeat-containing domain protein [Aspergillus carlsbadensis]|nr:ankyrin repeat-containing domain protein [Aspergillus carlsbadensis]